MNEAWIALDVDDVAPDPFEQFLRWFDDAREVMLEREAVALATANAQGRPSLRMVLLRYHDAGRFGWYTNYSSRKGGELAVNAAAALLWYCEGLGRQIRIEGDVAPMSEAASDAYFARRPRGSQLGAHASRQSQPLRSREELETRVAQLDVAFDGQIVPRPPSWGGYLLTPTHYEFWQHRDDRLHDRVGFTREGVAWRIERYSP